MGFWHLEGAYTPLGDLGWTQYPCIANFDSSGCSDPERNRNVVYAYTRGFMTMVQDTHGWMYATNMTYHPDGTLASSDNTAGVRDLWAQDAAGRLSRLSSQYPSSFYNKYLGPYQYDGSGNIRAITQRSRWTGTDVSPQFIYDAQGRLKSSQDTLGTTYTWQYDEFGNILAETCPGNCWFTRQPHQIVGTTNHYADYTYDDAGSVTRDGPSPATSGTYTYDALGMMTTAAYGQTNFRFIYSPQDERIVSVRRSGEGACGQTNNRSLWTLRGLDNQLLRAYTEDDTTGNPAGLALWADYIWRGANLLAQANENQTLRIQPDHLGTPFDVSAGGVQLGAPPQEYDPFGSNAGRADLLLNFTGQERDTFAFSSGNEPLPDNFHARYYSSQTGRFLSVDPVIDFKVAMKSPQMWNRYSYVGNNPMNRTDPDGRLIQFENGDYSREAAFGEFQKLFAKGAQKYLSMDKNGYARLNGIGLAAFTKQFGAVAGRLASMVVQQGWTANVTLSDSSFARQGGGANTRSFGTATRIDINPFLLENYGGHSASIGGVEQSIGSAMSHELLGHAYPFAFGVDNMSPHRYGWMNRGPKQEGYAIWAENQWRAQMGLPPRTFYTERTDYVPPDE